MRTIQTAAEFLFVTLWESFRRFCSGVASLWLLHLTGPIGGELQKRTSFWKVLLSPHRNTGALLERTCLGSTHSSLGFTIGLCSDTQRQRSDLLQTGQAFKLKSKQLNLPHMDSNQVAVHLRPAPTPERQTLWWLWWVATVKGLGTGRTYIFICLHLQKVIVHTAQMLPDKCPGNSIFPLWVAHLSWLRWRAEWGTDGTSSLMLALTYELQAEPDERTWLIYYGMFSRGSLESWAAPGINEGLDRNVTSRRTQCVPFICTHEPPQTPSFTISGATLFLLTFAQHSKAGRNVIKFG